MRVDPTIANPCTAVTRPSSPVICVGAGKSGPIAFRATLIPRPPHAQKVPSSLSANERKFPAQILATPVMPGTATGVSVAAVPGVPSWPRAPLPSAHTSPALESARIWSPPAAMERTPPGTSTLLGAAV